jgi:cytochrome oxidase assembly protein ShyY1
MDRYLLIELGSEGLAFETKNLDFYVSWFGIGLAVAVFVAVKVTKRYRRGA